MSIQCAIYSHNIVLMLQILSQSLTNTYQKPLFSTDKIQQCAVAMIFRVKKCPTLDNTQTLQHYRIKKLVHQLASPDSISVPDCDVELLFIQRAQNNKDAHSGEIAFPGGKNDEGEDDFSAVVRETIEETGLDLFDRRLNTLYLGRLPRQCYMRIQKDGRSLLALAHVFLIVDTLGITSNLAIQESEVQAYKWVKLDRFKGYKKSDFKLANTNHEFILRFLTNIFQAYPQIQSYVLSLPYRAMRQGIDIGMDHNLFGFTLSLVKQLCQIVINHPYWKETPTGVDIIATQLQIWKINFYDHKDWLTSLITKVTSHVMIEINAPNQYKHEYSIDDQLFIRMEMQYRCLMPKI